jgi:hypothetical protein
MGKKPGKTVKEKYARDFTDIFGFVFSLPKRERNAWRIEKKFGRERPGEHVWAAKPHKHLGRSRPNRGFRPRSFYRANFRSSFSQRGVARNRG